MSVFKDTSDEIVGDINKCDFLILYNEILQHLKDLHISVNQYFVNDPSLILQTNYRKKFIHNVDRSMKFNVTNTESLLICFQL